MAELETNGNEKKCERKLKWCHAYPIRSIDLIITDTTDSILDDWCVDLCVNNADVDVRRKSQVASRDMIPVHTLSLLCPGGHKWTPEIIILF